MGKTDHSRRELVVVLVNGAAERGRIRDAFNGRFDVAFVARVKELEQVLHTAESTVAAVIVEENDADERSTCDVVRAIKHMNVPPPRHRLLYRGYPAHQQHSRARDGGSERAVVPRYR